MKPINDMAEDQVRAELAVSRERIRRANVLEKELSDQNGKMEKEIRDGFAENLAKLRFQQSKELNELLQAENKALRSRGFFARVFNWD